MSEWLLEASGVEKSFGGVVALADGRFRLRRGSIHALCGGNGAGKSTFLSIIMGIHGRDGGSVRVRGQEMHFGGPRDALNSGIAIIEQELSPVPSMTVAENIFLGREPTRSFGRIDFATMNATSSRLLKDLGFDISPETKMQALSVAQMQLVEIAKALNRDAEILIMDEPTSALGEKEVILLFKVMRRLRDLGKGIIYVSHRLTEVFGIADQYTVFRDGRFVAEGALSDISRADLIRNIAGRELSEEYVKDNVPSDERVLSVRNLTLPGKLTDIDVDVRRGEIVGIYGLMGSGRTEFLECLFGLRDGWAGEVKVRDRMINIRSVVDAMRAGLAMVTEDRKQSGLNMIDSVLRNLSLPILPRIAGFLGVVHTGKEASLAQSAIERFNVKAATPKIKVSSLSGGNQQKVVMGKWHLTRPEVLLLDEPTRGVDVGAKREIYALMSQFVQDGGAIVMVSSEIEEILGVSDTVVVVRDGKVAGRFNRNDADQASLIHLAS